MRRSRDIVYINSYVEENSALYYGIEFQEFYHALRVYLQNLLLLKHEYPGASNGPNSHLDFRFDMDQPLTLTPSDKG